MILRDHITNSRAKKEKIPDRNQRMNTIRPRIHVYPLTSVETLGMKGKYLGYFGLLLTTPTVQWIHKK